MSEGKREKRDNYIILWIRHVEGESDWGPSFARGCTCNPAVMRQRHTPHTLSLIMYIINATAYKIMPPFASALPADDGVYQRSRKPKVTSKCRHQPTGRTGIGRSIIFDAASLWEIIFAVFHRRKSFLCLVLFTESRTGQRVSKEKTACYFCSSYRKRETFHLWDAREKCILSWQKKKRKQKTQKIKVSLFSCVNGEATRAVKIKRSPKCMSLSLFCRLNSVFQLSLSNFPVVFWFVWATLI